MKTESGHPVVY